MSLKSKGIAAERDLVHKLQDRGFAAIRVAGSGCTVTPSTDILAGNGRRILSVECKTVKGTSRYIDRESVNDFVAFSRQFGAEPWIAVRFFRTPWRFLLVEDIPLTDKNVAITQEHAESKGLLLEELLNNS
jgi:Holliday junction resolvase